MTEAKVIITAQDNASAVIDRVSQKLGIFNKQGLAMGVSFAMVNIAIQKIQEAFQKLIKEFMDGVERAKDFELNLVYVVNTMKNMDVTTNELNDSLHEMSRTFGVDVNSLTISLKAITREGNSASESLRILGQAQLFNTATGESLNSILDALDVTMGVFDLDTENSGYILEKLNTIINTTGLSVGEISDIFGRLSPEIRKAGYNLNDVVNILYTLAQTEIGSRKMAPAFEEYLKGMGFEKIKEVPTGATKSIEEQANAAINTHKKATDVIGAAWDGMWEDIGQGALDTIDFLNQKWSWDKGWYTEKTVLPGLGDTSPQVDWMDDYIKKQSALATEITDLTAKINEGEISLAAYNQQWERTDIQIEYTKDMRIATLAVKEQEDAIERLRRIANKYSLEQSANNLAIMRIQYGAGRRGLSRGQQRQIDIIERENMRLRIAEAEQQLSIGQIQANGLQTAQDNLDALRRSHDAILYSQELEDLNAHLKDVKKLYFDAYTEIAGYKQQKLLKESLVTTLPTYGGFSAEEQRAALRRRTIAKLRMG